MVRLKQVADEAAAAGEIGVEADEADPLVAGRNRCLRQDRPQPCRMPVPARRLEPRLLLGSMVVGERQRHQLIEVDGARTVFGHQPRTDRRQLEPLPDHGGGDAEAGGDLLGTVP